MTLKNLKRIAQYFGLEVHRFPGNEYISVDGSYDIVRPNATYSPWRVDTEFQKAYSYIRKSTLVDELRCWELWQLLKQTIKSAEGDILEVGVWRGGTGALLAQCSKLYSISNNIYLCDTFSGVVKAGAKDTRYTNGEHADTNKSLVEELLKSLQVDENVKILTGIFPEETGNEIELRKFRFCHIDVDVYQSAKDILLWVWPRMPKGAIIVFDDYGFKGCEGVARLVEEFNKDLLGIFLHNLNGHAIIVKL